MKTAAILTLWVALMTAAALAACSDQAYQGSMDASATVSDIGCPRSTCKALGLCTLTGHGCLAANAQDCRPSQACISKGRCDARDGVCVGVR